jgi:hypothetical protein
MTEKQIQEIMALVDDFAEMSYQDGASLRKFKYHADALGVRSAIESALREQVPEVGKLVPVAYLDIGAGGYVDLGSELSADALAELPKGRHMLAIIGTYGVDGYTAAPQLAQAEQSKAVQEPVYCCAVISSIDELQGVVDWRPFQGNPLKLGDRLYTAPQQQEPMTDEQFNRIKSRLSRQQGWDGDGWDQAIKEEIERFHGITKDAK